MHDVFCVKLEVEPGAAIGDDAAGKKQFARAVRFALVMIKEHARRTVHLADDHAFCAVHYERAVRRHQRHIAHENVLLFDVFDRLCAGVFIHIKHDQTERDLQRRGISHIALLAFLYVIFRLLQLVFYELEHRRLVEILDRKDRLEDTHDAFTIHRLELVTRVQEKIVRRFLHLNEVWHVQDFPDFAEIFAETFLTEKCLSHALSHSIFVCKHTAGLRLPTLKDHLEKASIPARGPRACVPTVFPKKLSLA